MAGGVFFDSEADFDRMARAVKDAEQLKKSAAHRPPPPPSGGANVVVVRITGPSTKLSTTTTTSGAATTTTTTTTPAGTTSTTTSSIPATVWPGVFVHRFVDGQDKEIWYEGDVCWVAPVSRGDDLTIGRQYEGYVAGIAADHYPLVVVNACCVTTTSTSTTPGACTGSCRWDFNFVLSKWEKTSSSCSANCACLAPDYCPPPGSHDVFAVTGCGRFPTDKTPPVCTVVTTTTTPGSCLPSNCTGSCKWVCHPVYGWQRVTNPCASNCPCPPPTGPCVTDCADVTTSCFFNAFCQGMCRWVWIDFAGGPTPYWERISTGCESNNVPDCFCDPPSHPGGDCGEEAVTGCYPHNQTTGNCPPITTTTTTPSGCNGVCLWYSKGSPASWFLASSCPGCGCLYPPIAAPEGGGSITTQCMSTTTTTTTSTTTTTTTTTTPACTGNCTFICAKHVLEDLTVYFAWQPIFSLCSTHAWPCHCVWPSAECNSVEELDDIETTGCVSSNPFTTTTTAGSCGDCTWQCVGGSWVEQLDNCSGSCVCDPPIGSCSGVDVTQTYCVEP